MDEDSLKITVAGDFPADLSANIYVGDRGPYRDSEGNLQASPFFHTDGKDGEISAAEIQVDLGTTVSVIRKDAPAQQYLLYLFTSDSGGKVLGLFDLDIDGQWDVKKTPTKEKKNFIWLQGGWVEVNGVDGLRSLTPSATGEGVRFEFNGTWAKAD